MGKMIPGFLILLSIMFVQGCDVFEPSASIEIIRWEQSHYEFSYGDKWGNVEVWYKIRNTGNVDIDYYKIWFTATCSNGVTYEDWTNGLSLDTGHSLTDNAYIGIPDKQVQSIEITDYELTTY